MSRSADPTLRCHSHLRSNSGEYLPFGDISTPKSYERETNAGTRWCREGWKARGQGKEGNNDKCKVVETMGYWVAKQYNWLPASVPESVQELALYFSQGEATFEVPIHRSIFEVHHPSLNRVIFSKIWAVKQGHQ